MRYIHVCRLFLCLGLRPLDPEPPPARETSTRRRPRWKHRRLMQVHSPDDLHCADWDTLKNRGSSCPDTFTAAQKWWVL